MLRIVKKVHFTRETLAMPTWQKNHLKSIINKQFLNWKEKPCLFLHSAIKRAWGSLSYRNSEMAIFFLKVWSNFVEKINAIEQYLVG